MEEKKISEFKTTAKEWGTVTGKVFHQVDRELGVKGRIAVGFGIAIVWLLGGILAHVDQHDRSFDRDGRGSMMQERGNMMKGKNEMMGFFGREAMQDQGFGVQGCAQQATVEIDPQNPDNPIIRSQSNCPFANQTNGRNIQNDTNNSMFDRMENKMKQFFGSDNKGDQAATQVVVTGTVSQ